ncbi:unnamed protein product [Ixodes persulcatus]
MPCRRPARRSYPTVRPAFRRSGTQHARLPYNGRGPRAAPFTTYTQPEEKKNMPQKRLVSFVHTVDDVSTGAAKTLCKGPTRQRRASRKNIFENQAASRRR